MEAKALTVKEIAAYLRVHTDMIYALVRHKQIPHVRLGSRILFTKSAIDQWIGEHEEQSLQK